MKLEELKVGQWLLLETATQADITLESLEVSCG